MARSIDCPDDHRAFAAAQYDAGRVAEGAAEVVTTANCGAELDITDFAAAQQRLVAGLLAGAEAATGLWRAVLVEMVVDASGWSREEAECAIGARAAKAREFIQGVAQNSIVAEDFTEGNEVFNEVVRAARAAAAELGIRCQPGEGPVEEDISAEEYEAWPGNQPGATATGGSP